MTWKRVKVGLLVLLGLVIIVPLVLYVSSIDLSKSYSASVQSLPLYDHDQRAGEYRLQANDLEFKTRLAGFQNTGDNVILLHGFPQTSKIWEPTMESAAAAGYRVLAYDQRGYSPGARPSGKDNYNIDLLVADLLTVADAVGFDTFHLVGHDWGASVGWKTVMDYPERIKSWTALSIPHIAVFQEAFNNHPEQKKKSSYINGLRKPILPEFLFVLNSEKMMKRVEGIWRDEEIKEVQSLLAEHGALTGAINWYRAMDNTEEQLTSIRKLITRPTLYVWGNQDPVISADIIPLQAPLIKASYKAIELDAGHSLIQEKRDTVINAILEHIGSAQF